jgi:hypothetical protein
VPAQAPVVRAVGASRSTSVASDLDAIAAGSVAGQRGVLGAQPREAGSVRQEPLDPRATGRTRHLSAQDANFVAEHYDLDGQVLLPIT